MSLKTLLCLFTGEREDLGTLEMAFALARRHGAALRILHLARPPAMYAAVADYGAAALAAGMNPNLMDEQTRELDEDARAFAAEFAQGHGVELLAADAPAPGPLQAYVRTVIGEPDDCLPIHGRTVDLVLCGADRPSGPAFTASLAALSRTGCPVLLVPASPVAMITNAGLARTVTIGWDRSLEAARAVRAALPLLETAETVHILCIREGEEIPGEASQADLLAWLGNHGIVADIHSPNRDFQSVGEVLLWQSSRLSADLLVMGAYSRGHLLEMLTFGTSDHVHRHARIPLFMAH
jgi:nucleotide-binding universal stress UspA family protein